MSLWERTPRHLHIKAGTGFTCLQLDDSGMRAFNDVHDRP